MSGNFTHVMIRASAGSGKTFQLSNRYLKLLLRGVPPERILAVTFTRKAAGEIFDRILLRLAEAVDNPDKRKELGNDLTSEQCRDLLCEVTRSLHRLRIGTLDSFFAKVAGTCAMEVGLPHGWRIVEPLADQRLHDRAIAESLSGESTARLLTLFHLLTKGEATRGISQLIRDAVNNLYSTYQTTGPADWKKLPRVKGLTQPELAAALNALEGVTFSDQRFNKAVAVDRENILKGAWEDFIAKGLTNKILHGETTYRNMPIGEEVIALYQQLLQQARSVLVNRVADQTEATYDLLAHFDTHYRRLKHLHAALRFDDITNLLARVANADDPRTSFRIDARLDHLLLDEFQDTSLAQWQVLRPLAKRVTARNESTSFFCVGDVKQAIYGWRGGLAELFDAVETELGNLHRASLTTSYRSSPAVIEVVNRVFGQLHRHDNLEKLAEPIQQWQQRFQTHSTAKAALAGYVTLETGPALNEEEEKNEQFAEFVAERIAEEYRRAPGCSIGVLTRKNEIVRDLIFRLRNRGVPASEEGGNPLVDSAAVDLILSLVRLADHPGDSAALFHVQQSPLAVHFELGGEGNSLRREYLSERLRRKLHDAGYGQAVQEWSQLLSPACDARERTRLQQLVELAFTYQPESTLRPGDFLNFVRETKVSDPTTAAVRVMTVHQAKGLEFDIVFLPELDARLTGQTPTFVVSRPAAGAPIDCVCRYANENVRELLPTSFQKMFTDSFNDDISEAMCVLYVAITRAVHALHMLIRPLNETEKTHPKTYAGLVRASLCDSTAPNAGVLFTHGQADWYTRTFGHSTVETATNLPVASLPQIQLAPPPVERRRGLQRESPSGMEGGQAARLARMFELVDPDREQAMQRGTAFHAFFEQITWLEDSTPSDEAYLAALRRVPDMARVPLATQQAWLEEFRTALAREEVQGVLRRSTYLKSLPSAITNLARAAEVVVQNEWPFVIVDGSQMLQGRMDRVVFLQAAEETIAADVLDYKTDFISTSPGQTLPDLVEHYRPQIEAYRRTLSQLTHLPPERITAGLVFVSVGKLVRL